MDRSPLLQRPDVQNCRASKLHRAYHIVKEWLALSTDPAYLNSNYSRRFTWKYVSLLFTILLISHAVYLIIFEGWVSAAVDLITAVSCLLMYFVPIGTIWSDFVIMLIQSLIFSVALEQDSAGGFALGCNGPFSSSPWLLNNLLIATSFGLIGFHSTSLMLFAILQVPTLLITQDLEDFLFAIGFLFFVIAPVSLIEYQTVSTLQELAKQSKGMDLLLDNASDGWCCVDKQTGKIISASDTLLDTFKTPNLLGTRFLELVQISDRDKLEHLATRSLDAAVCESHVVTCLTQRLPKAEFDAAVTCYATSEDVAQLCIRKFGELRQHGLSVDDSNPCHIQADAHSLAPSNFDAEAFTETYDTFYTRQEIISHVSAESMVSLDGGYIAASTVTPSVASTGRNTYASLRSGRNTAPYLAHLDDTSSANQERISRALQDRIAMRSDAESMVSLGAGSMASSAVTPSAASTGRNTYVSMRSDRNTLVSGSGRNTLASLRSGRNTAPYLAHLDDTSSANQERISRALQDRTAMRSDAESMVSSMASSAVTPSVASTDRNTYASMRSDRNTLVSGSGRSN